MKFRHLGKHGIKVSEVSLGAWITYGESVENSVAKQCVKTAIEQKVNFIDIADIYAKGNAERVVGGIVADEGYARKDLVISSKVFWPMSDNVNDVGLSRKHIFESIDASLDRLNMDYLDIYFCHRYDGATPLEETAMAMHDLIKQGKIRYWGTSVWSSKHLERVIGICKEHKLIMPAVEQPRYNMLDRHIELDVMETATYHGIGIVPWSPLAQGILTGKYNDGSLPLGSRAATSSEKSFIRRDTSNLEMISKSKKIADLAKELEIKSSQLALAWVLRRSEISSVITGASKPEQVIENVKTVEIDLSDDTLSRIEEILDNKPKRHPVYQKVLADR